MKKVLIVAGLLSCLLLAFSVQAQSVKPISPCEEAEAMRESFRSHNIIMNEEEAKELKELEKACRQSRILPK